MYRLYYVAGFAAIAIAGAAMLPVFIILLALYLLALIMAVFL